MNIGRLFVGIERLITRWNLIRRFNVVSLIIMILGTMVIGSWVSKQIETSIINESATTTALYLASFFAPNLQELAHSEFISPASVETLNNALYNTNLGQQIAVVKVWNKDGKILYSTSSALTGRVFPVADDLDAAWQGRVVAQISNLQEEENFDERRSYSKLLEIYVPIRLNASHQVIAIAEFYQKADALEMEIAQAQQKSWLAVGAGMGLVYLWLVGFFRWTRNRIEQQEIALNNQVALLTEVLSLNEDLDQRVRRAVANTATLNERLLHRISIDLMGGPAKEIGAALSQLEQSLAEIKFCTLSNPTNKCNENLPVIQKSLQTSMQEISAIAGGLGLPQLDGLTLPEVFKNAVKSHEARTGTQVIMELNNLPDQASLPCKITAYRIVQESLNNAYRHAKGLGQKVRVGFSGNELHIEISDQGPGFEPMQLKIEDGRLGLAGMRERVESLGGQFSIESRINEGTKIDVRLFFHMEGEMAPVIAGLERQGLPL